MPLPSEPWVAAHLNLGRQHKIFTHAACIPISAAHVSSPIVSYDSPGTYFFDIASLTKPLVTATVVARMVDAGGLNLDVPLNEMIERVWKYMALPIPDQNFLQQCKPYTLRHVLGHCVPFPARIEIFRHFPLNAFPRDRDTVIRFFLKQFQNGSFFRQANDSKTLYSDVTYMFAGIYLESLHGKRLSEIFRDHIPTTLHSEFEWPQSSKNKQKLFVPTESCAFRGRRLSGEVHDENSFVFEGDAGHAGLFATPTGVAQLMKLWIDSTLQGTSFLSRNTARLFSQGVVQGDGFGGYYFRVGWDSPGPHHAQGLAQRGWSSDAFGHWGFTGVGAWYDPADDSGLVLLTNHVYYGRSKQEYHRWRGDLFQK